MQAEKTESPFQEEVEKFLQTRVVRRRLLPRAVLVGLVAGLVATLFRLILEMIDRTRVAIGHEFDTAPVRSFIVTACIIAIGTWIGTLVSAAEPDAAGSGIPQMKASLEGHLKQNWARVLYLKFVGALAALGSGLAMGREGPTIQMGGAVGHLLASATKANGRERRALTSAGAGAGLAAAFNAPLAGVTFVLEELQRDFQPVVFVAALLCAAVATVVSRFASGQMPAFDVPEMPPPPLGSLPLFVVIGLLGGLASVLFNKALLGSMSFFKPIRQKHRILFIGGVALVLAAASAISPDLLGGGHSLSEDALAGTYLLPTALLLFVIRFGLIHLSYSTGVPGGIFAPLLSLGALLGLIVFRLATLTHVDAGLALAAAGVAGMCAMFSGVVRAPLTGVILIVEMTGSYDLLLPLLVTAFCSYLVAEGLKDMPVYEALLHRIAANRGFELDEDEDEEGRQVVELEIRPESPLCNRRIRDAGLPKGCLVVLCTMNGREILPTGQTMLSEHMKVTFLCSSRSLVHTVQQLTKGTLPSATLDEQTS